MIARHLAPLHQASRHFIARWRVRERESATTGRHIEAAVVMLVCGFIVWVAWFGDLRAAVAVRDISDAWRGPFQRINMLGESGWLFAVSAFLVAGALLARHRGLGRRVDAALGLLAGRAFFVFAVLAVSGLLSLIVKSLFGRARPRLLDMVGPFHFDMFSVKSSLLSFPSGHAVTAFGAASAIAFLAPRLGWPAFFLAVMVGVARVVTGAHFPSDVIAGMALGVATTIILRRAFAARGIVFRHTDRGVALRGAGLVAPLLRQALRRRDVGKSIERSAV
ncbi:MAG: phosphatase PAP2 family protein [Beijerinckiaceae bacterium]|nr:phosphatase PAP2 family protein [Beijerinckiaceae bacterium]